MKTKLVLTILFSVLFAELSFSQNSEMQTRTFKVNPGGNLIITLTYGDIHLSVGKDNEVNVKYADEENDFEITQSGSNIDINSPSGSEGNDIYVTIPSAFNINTKTMGGDIQLNGALKGKLECSTSGGDIKCGNVEGNVKLQTSGGDIFTGEINGNAGISTSGGDITLGKISGKASINTSGGTITMNSVGSTAEIITGGGNVSAWNIGGETEIRTGGGNINAGKVTGNADLKTGGGDIVFEGATGSINIESGAGNIKVNNSGNKFSVSTGAGDINVKVSDNLKGESQAKSGTGTITLYIPENAKVTIDASVQSVGWGDESNIISDFAPSKTSGGRKGSHQTFNINGGGTVIKVSAALGSIQVKKLR